MHVLEYQMLYAGVIEFDKDLVKYTYFTYVIILEFISTNLRARNFSFICVERNKNNCCTEDH